MRSYLRLVLLCSALLFASRARAQVELGEAIRENLGAAINTASTEMLPIVSADGSTLYFDRKYDVGNVGGVRDEDDIYFSTRLADGSWSRAQNIGAPLNTPGSDVLFWLSADGNTALVSNGAVVNGKKAGLAIARRRNGTWAKPVAIRIAGISSLGDSYYGFIAPDERHLLVAYAPDPAKPTGFDIFVCDAIDDELLRWGAPRSLGSTINTPSFDGAPFLGSDNRTLYFASDGHGGIGSSDLFVARRLDSSWTNWSTPVNMGGNVNTPRFDASLSVPADGRDIYISGSGFVDDQGFGKSDIFRIPLSQQLRPYVVVTIEGRLLAGSRGRRGLVRAERTLDHGEVASSVSDAQGRFQFTLPAGIEYRLTGGADGYSEGSTTVDARSMTSSQTVVATIHLGRERESAASEEPAPDEIGIHFASGSAALTTRAFAGLEKALATLRRDLASGRVTAVVVRGHTDDVGEIESNVELSRLRAEAVRAWLVERGIDAAIISIEALGESTPIAMNATTAGRARNRRVEVHYVVERPKEVPLQDRQ